MKIIVDIPDFDGNGIDVIWENGSNYIIKTEKNTVTLMANKNGLISLGKQLLYMAYNYNELPIWSHVHFDSFFTKRNIDDVELVITKMRDQSGDQSVGNQGTNQGTVRNH